MAEARSEAAAVVAASGEDDSGKVRGYPEAPYEAPKPPPNLPEGRGCEVTCEAIVFNSLASEASEKLPLIQEKSYCLNSLTS